MMRRVMLAAAAVAVCFVMSGSEADAGHRRCCRVKRCHTNHRSCCAPSCAAPCGNGCGSCAAPCGDAGGCGNCAAPCGDACGGGGCGNCAAPCGNGCTSNACQAPVYTASCGSCAPQATCASATCTSCQTQTCGFSSCGSSACAPCGGETSSAPQQHQQQAPTPAAEDAPAPPEA